MSPTARRPPILTLFAAACGLDVTLRLASLILGGRPESFAIWYQYGYRPVWALVSLFPTPGPLPAWVLSFFLPSASGPANVAAVALGVVLAAFLGAGLWLLTRWSRVACFVLVPAAAVAAIAASLTQDTMHRESIFLARVVAAAQLSLAVAVVVVVARRDFGRTPARVSPASKQLPLRAISILTAVSGLLALVDSATIFILSRRPQDAPHHLWWALPVLAALACARLASAQSDRLALGFALGLCACHVLLIAPFLLVVPFVVLMLGAKGLPIAAIPPLSGLGLVFGTAALRKLPDRGIGNAGTGGIGIFLALAMSWTIGSLTAHEGRVLQSSPAQDQQFAEEQRSAKAARGRVRAVARCAILYQAGHAAEGYPVDLMALGPGGSKCLAADQLGGQDDDYAYVYEASGAGGRDHFRVTAQARQGRLLEKVISVDDGVGIEDDFSYVPAVALMQNLWSCIEQLRLQEPSHAHPTSLTPVLALAGDHQPRCVIANGEQKIGEWPAATAVTFQDYELVYTPTTGGSVSRSGYALAARPREWGARYFRSYLMNEDGIIHGTSLPRAATADDPEIRGCESGDRGCFSGPGSLEFVDGGLPAQ